MALYLTPAEISQKRFNIKNVSDLEINVIYVLDSFERKTGNYGEYYYCKGYRKDTGEKVRLRSSYYLKHEIEIFESLDLENIKFSFKVTRVRQNDYGNYVASVMPTY